MASSISWFDLPKEIWVNILLLLDLDVLLPLRQVSKSMEALVYKTIKCMEKLNLKVSYIIENSSQSKQIFQKPFNWQSLRMVDLKFENSQDLQLLVANLPRSLEQATIWFEHISNLSLTHFIDFHHRLTSLNVTWCKGTLFTSDIKHIFVTCQSLKSVSLDTFHGQLRVDVELVEEDFQKMTHPLQHLKCYASDETETKSIALIIGKLLCQAFSSTIESAELMAFPDCAMPRLKSLAIFMWNSNDTRPMEFLPNFEKALFFWPSLSNLTIHQYLNDQEIDRTIGHCQNLRSVKLELTNATDLALTNLALRNHFLRKIFLKIRSTCLSVQTFQRFFTCCTQLEVLSVVSIGHQNQITFNSNDFLHQIGKSLKILKLHFDEWNDSIENAIASICNACPELANLELVQLPGLPLNLPKLEILSLAKNPDRYKRDWISQFPNIRHFVWNGSEEFERLEFLENSNISKAEFNLDFVHPSVTIPNLVALKLYGDICDEEKNTNATRTHWNSSDLANFLEKHGKKLEKFHFDIEISKELLAIIAQQCTNLEQISTFSQCFDWKLFCQHRKECGNIGKKLRIVTKMNINYDLLLEANATTFRGESPWSNWDSLS